MLGVASLAEKLVVVDADDGDILGNHEVVVATDFQELLTACVVAGEDADGLRQALQPGPDRFALCPPADARFLPGRQIEDPRSDDVGSPQYSLEALLPPDRPVVERVAEEGEVLQAAVPKVVEGKVRDRLVVGLDPGDALDQAGGTDVDRRHVHGRDDARHAIGFDPRDDPVELPVAGE